MGEIITKIALVVFGVSLYKAGILSSHFATIFTVALVVLNFLRDINLRYRQAIRMMPGYGIWFFAAFFIIFPTNAALKKLIGMESWGFSHWEAVAAAGILSMLFRAYMIACESVSRWTVYSLGWDNRRVDYAMDYTWRNGFITRYFYWNPDYLHGDFENYHDQDFYQQSDPDEFDEYFDESQNYGEPTDIKCITCCPVQPKR